MGNKFGAAAPNVVNTADLETHSIEREDLPESIWSVPEGFVPPEPEPVDLPAGVRNKFAVVLKDVFSSQEVEAIVRLAEAKGFEAARVNGRQGRETLDRDYRRGERCLIDSMDLGKAIFARVRHALPPTWHEHWHLCGCNERLRILKYQPGDFFARHMDGTYIRRQELGPERAGETSHVTLQLYLNGGMGGGATAFFPTCGEGQPVAVAPEPGMVLLFEHRIVHEGALVTAGHKYTLRTDIMYTLKGAGLEY